MQLGNNLHRLLKLFKTFSISWSFLFVVCLPLQSCISSVTNQPLTTDSPGQQKRVSTLSREEFTAPRCLMWFAFWVRAPETVCPSLASHSLRDKQHKCDRFSGILHPWHVCFQSKLFHSYLNGSKILAQLGYELTWVKQPEHKCTKVLDMFKRPQKTCSLNRWTRLNK